MEMLTQVLGAFISCIGFAIIYRTKKNRLILCGLSAALGWAVCYLVQTQTSTVFTIYFSGAAFVTLFSEIFARITKTPATIYLVPGLLPMVPGGSLYYTTHSLVMGDQASAKIHGTNTLLAALGIALGLVVVSVVTHYYNDYKIKKTASQTKDAA